ncbi:hypothetical protein F7725_003044 [Dissostichus mawsoni]|uniref:PX domain-containing protein n=1 Tax=Dissostichus mawsoni TaxID=36200 RepID=A0A7J5Y931_DISMA|nr:hypothetical protein F7725_003044 [Dissostichus mawsoni]
MAQGIRQPVHSITSLAVPIETDSNASAEGRQRKGGETGVVRRRDYLKKNPERRQREREGDSQAGREACELHINPLGSDPGQRAPFSSCRKTPYGTMETRRNGPAMPQNFTLGLTKAVLRQEISSHLHRQASVLLHRNSSNKHVRVKAQSSYQLSAGRLGRLFTTFNQLALPGPARTQPSSPAQRNHMEVLLRSHDSSVPAYYREVYEAIRCRTDERVQVEVFQRLLQRTDISKPVLGQIAEQVDSTDGFLSKSLYKALALIALAQQGKQPSPKLLENCIQELPKPQLGEPRELNALRMQPAQEDVLTMSQTLDKLLGRDTVQLELIPEKKGLFLKHVEYQRFKISVYRRYSDFDVFHEVLLQRFAYRVVPALPPKRMLKGVLTSVSEREFIECRRRALGRFINLVARHPFFSEDELVKTFLTFSGSVCGISETSCLGCDTHYLEDDCVKCILFHELVTFSTHTLLGRLPTQDVQSKLRDAYKKTGDEFMTNRIATLAKEYLPADIQAQFSTSRELIRNIHNSFQKLRDRAEKMAERSKENATDLLMFGRELSTLGSDGSSLPSLASSQSTWGTLRQSLKSLSVEFAVLSDKAAQQGRREEDDVVEKLNIFLDLLQSYRDLCERHEKGVLHEHQRALHKYGMMKRQMMSASVQPKEQASVEQLESRIVQQENAIQTMELRNYFSLFCLHQETQLIFIYLPITSHILGAFVNSQVQGHREMGAVWNELQPKLGCLFGVITDRSPPSET